MRKPNYKYLLIALACGAAACLSSCIGFGGGGVTSPLFSAQFRESSSFPHLDPFDNVLLVDVSDAVDRLATPPTLKVSIDNTVVHTQTVNQGGRIEVTFPPAAWTPSDGDHEVELEMGDILRTLTFSWDD